MITKVSLEEEGKYKRVSASQKVVETVRDAIQRGELKVGDRLPSEQELAKMLGVGRSSLREGMRILASYGIVSIQQGEGTIVTNKYVEQVFDFLGFFPNKANLRHLIQLRRVLEAGAIKVVCGTLNNEQFDKLSELVKAMEDPSPIYVYRSIQSDTQFHELLINAAKNPLLTQIYNMMSKMMSTLMQQLMCFSDVEQDAYKYHKQILQSLKDNDLETAIRTLDDHLKRVEYYVDKYLPDEII